MVEAVGEDMQNSRSLYSFPAESTSIVHRMTFWIVGRKGRLRVEEGTEILSGAPSEMKEPRFCERS